jgi:hypothetical protein
VSVMRQFRDHVQRVTDLNPSAPRQFGIHTREAILKHCSGRGESPTTNPLIQRVITSSFSRYRAIG